MCASLAMFNTIDDPNITMNFESPLNSNNQFFSTSPSFNSFPSIHRQLSIDQNINSLNNTSHPSFDSSPTYASNLCDDMKIDYKKKAKNCLVCGEPALVVFFFLIFFFS